MTPRTVTCTKCGATAYRRTLPPIFGRPQPRVVWVCDQEHTTRPEDLKDHPDAADDQDAN